MKYWIITVLVLLTSLSMLQAQDISQYTFSTTTTGSLEDMSSGTTDLLPSGTYYYLVSSGIADIGFAFNFGPSLFTQFSANSNGQMQLGGEVISGNANPTAGKSILAPISNGVAGNNAIVISGKLHYKVTGSAPNRKLTVEWLNMRIPYGNFTETGTYCRMQAWLFETTNVVQFVYGTMYRMGTIAQNRGVCISTSNVAGTVGNVKTIQATPTWDVAGTTTIVSTFSTNTYTNLSSSADGSRRVFTFTPPVVSTVPNPAVLVGPDNSGWTFTNAILSWEGGGGQPTSYDLYFGTSPTPPFIGNQSAGYYTPILEPGNTYYWKVVPKNSFGDAVGCPTWSFKTPTLTQLAESFEGTMFSPPGWANPSGFSRNTTPGTAKFGVACAAKTTSTTAVYILSTPLCAITPSSTLDFYSMAGNTTRILQVVYSTDRVNWTQVGANITYAAANTWYRTTIYLVNEAGNNYYLGFRTPAQANGSLNNVFVDYVFGPEIAPEVPAAVTLTSPSNGFTVVTQPTLTWNTSTTTGGIPSEYKVYVDTNPDPVTLVATVTMPTFTFATPLDPLTLYYWKVVASNSAGDSPASAIRSFTTTVNTLLPATNPVPVDGATGVATNATLSWDPSLNTSYYKVYFGTTLPATTNVANITATSWTPPTMIGGVTYYWKVVPFHTTAGDAVGCPTWSFTTLAVPPLPATNPVPANAAVNVAINASLSWTASLGATSYDVYFGTVLPGTPNANIPGTSWTPPVMTNLTAYQWMVVPRNANGPATGCPTWTFTTIVTLPVAAVNPVPANGAFNVAVNVSLSWDAVPNAASYDVYFGTALPGTPTINVISPTWTPPVLAYATSYQWKVVPKNAAGSATGVVTWTFTTAPPLPLAATNPSPTDGAIDVAADATLSWSPVVNAAFYDIYFGPTLPSTVTAITTVPNWTPTLAYNTSYQWKVVPRNAGGSALACPTWSFTTVMPQPLAVPTGVTVTTTGTTRNLSWNAVSGATFYTIYAATDPFALPGGWTQISTSATNSFSHTDAPGATMFYRITACNNQ